MKSESVFQGLDRAFWCKFCAAGAGSVLEWYDFAAFGSLADVIGDVLLPPSHSALVDALAVFGAAFLMRPLGAIFIGAIADAYSRKLALEISILLMVLPTLCIAALPSYAFAGNSSTALLVLLRLAQGFFVGAELTTAFVFVYENAPQPRNASVLAALQYNFVSVGSLAGLGVAVGLRASLSPEALRSWGWRVALAAAGLWLRFRLEDASDNTRKGTKTPLTWAALRAPMAAALRYGNRRRMACFSVVAAAKLMPYYVIFVWLPLGFRQLGVPSAYSLAAVGTAFFCVAAICLAPLVRAPPPKDGESPWADDDDEEEDECAGVEESALLSLGKAAPPADSRRGRLEMSANARYWYKVGAGLLIVVSPAFFVALAAYPSTPLAIAMLGVIAFGCALIAARPPRCARRKIRTAAGTSLLPWYRLSRGDLCRGDLYRDLCRVRHQRRGVPPG